MMRNIGGSIAIAALATLDVALEALSESLRSKKAKAGQIWEAASVSRVANVIRPYMGRSF